MPKETFDKIYGSQYVDLSVSGRIKWYISKWRHQPEKRIKKALLTGLPFVSWISSYNIKSDLLPDFMAGCTVGIMNIPQGMAYGILARLPPQYGLYTSFFPPLIYSFLGTSRHVSFGTFAVISLMVRTVIEKNVPPTGPISIANSTSTDLFEPFKATTDLSFASTSTQESGYFTSEWDYCGNGNVSYSDGRDITAMLNVAFCLTFLVGAFQIIFGFIQAGFIAVYLSDQLVEGLTTGAAVQVLTSQIGHLVGIAGLPSTSGRFAMIRFYVCMFYNIAKANIITLLISFCCLLTLIVVKYWLEPKMKKHFKFPVPIELFIVVIMTAVSYWLDLHQVHGVSVVGFIPTGLPSPSIPKFDKAADMVPDAIAIAIVVFSISVSIGKLFAKKHDYNINANQEWYAYGAVHLISSFFSCHCAGSSLSRGVVQETQGGKTQLVSVFSCLIILLVLLFLAPTFKYLPQCALAAIIVVNLKSMLIQVNKLPSLWRRSKIDFLIWIVTFVSVILFDVTYGLIVGVVFAMMTVLFRSQWPDSICLGNVPGTEIYKGLNAYNNAMEIPGVKIYRFESPLYFANASLFKEQLYHKTNFDPMEMKRAQSIPKVQLDSLSRSFPSRSNLNLVLETETAEGYGNADLLKAKYDIELSAIIIDCSSFPYMDLTGVETLRQVYDEYTKVSIKVIFCSVKVAVRQLFDACNFYESVPKSSLYLTVHDAVIALQAEDKLTKQIRKLSNSLRQGLEHTTEINGRG